MSDAGTIRVFIGSGEASRVERKTLIHSIRKNTRRPVDIYAFNGTHNAIELNDEPPVPAGLGLRPKYMNVTEFSNYRFLIPEVMGHRGRAIWIDSDTLCLCDLGELFDLPMNGRHFLCKPDDRYPGRWALSVMLIDCERTRFDIERYVDDIEAGRFTYGNMMDMEQAFLRHHPFEIGPLDPKWNSFDYHDAGTKLIHYTNLFTQPWKFPGHPYGELWFRYFGEARAAGVVTHRDIELSLARAYVRQDLLKGNCPRLRDRALFYARAAKARVKRGS